MVEGSTARFEIGQVVNNVGRIFGEAWRPLLPIMIGFVFAPQIVVAAITVTAMKTTPALVGVLGLVATLTGLIGFAAAIAVTLAGLDVLTGAPDRPERLLARTTPLYLPALGMSLLVGLGVFGGTLLFIVPGIFLAIAWYVALPVRLAENIKATDAMRRSLRLTASFRWPIVGVILILIGVYLLLSIVSGLAGVVLRLVGLGLYGPVLPNAVVSTIGVMASAAAQVAVYHELVRIKEGGGPTVADLFT